MLATVHAVVADRIDELVDVLPRIHRDARRRLRRLVQALGARGADLDPRDEIAAQIALDQRRLAVVGDPALAELEAVGVLERTGDDPGYEISVALGRVLRHPKLELFIDATVDIRERDLDLPHRGRQRHLEHREWFAGR